MSVPEEFIKVVKDFVGDLCVTFPEYGPFIEKWWKSKEFFDYIEDEEERNRAREEAETNSVQMLFEYAKKKLPPRFFDILYQNESIFQEDSEVDTEFFPKIHFKNLWQCDISAKTRETIWKYLQLMMFAVVGTMDNKDAFGDTAKLFEAINEDEFKTKLQETLAQMQGLFDLNGGAKGEGGEGQGGEEAGGLNPGDLPNAEEINEHITGMLGGKIGQLAREIAEETAQDLNLDMSETSDMKDVFQNMMKNPTKLMGLVKTVGSKLDAKIKSGELKESEMIQEATDIMNKMKNMPGMGNIQSMLNKMGMGGMGKMNTGAMEAQMNRNLKTAQMKERIRAKAQANALKKQFDQQAPAPGHESKAPPAISDEDLVKIFSTEEKAERTPRPNPQAQKKKKGKK